MGRAAREAQRAARRVRLDAGRRRAADGGEAGGVEGVPAGAAEPAGKRGGCLGGGGVAGEALSGILSYCQIMILYSDCKPRYIITR